MTSRQKMLRILSASFVLLACLAWVVLANRPPSTSTELVQEAVPLTVPTRLAKRVSSLDRERTFTGEVRAARTSQLSFESSGRVIRLHVDEGAAVEQGQVLGEIDLSQVATRLESARAAVLRARAQLNEQVAGPREEVIAASRANATSLAADVRRLQRDFERAERLVAASSISEERFDAVRFQLDSARARSEAAQQQLAELEAGTRAEQIDAQEAALAGLQADQRTLELDLDDAKLLAPFSGIIARRLFDEGTYARTGDTVFELVEADKLEAWVGLPPEVACSLKLGCEYTGRILDQQVSMELRSLRPQLDTRTRTQNVVFDIQRDALDIVPGQIVRLELNLTAEADGFLLPTSALAPAPRGLWSVYVAKPVDGEYVVEQRDVTLVETFGTKSLVAGTLESNMHVILDGTHRVVPGQRVMISPRASID